MAQNSDMTNVNSLTLKWRLSFVLSQKLSESNRIRKFFQSRFFSEDKSWAKYEPKRGLKTQILKKPFIYKGFSEICGGGSYFKEFLY